MDFLERLKMLMNRSEDNNSSLAKKSGIPYTTIDGLFKRGWEKAQISTIQKICNYYGVSLDYMIYGAEKLSANALLVAAAYDDMSLYGKAVIDAVIQNESVYGRVIKREEERIKERQSELGDYLEGIETIMEY